MLRTFSRCRLLHRQSIQTTAILKRSLVTYAHDKGPSQPPLLELTIPQHFASIVSEHGDRPAVISRHQQTTLTYDSLNVSSNALARGLANIGVKKGDRVAVSLGNNVEFAVATYALFKLGAILVPLNPAFNALQVTSALAHLEASHLIIGVETNLPWKAPRSNIPLLTHLVPNLHSKKHGSSGSARLESQVVPSLQQIILVDNSSSASNIDISKLGALRRYTQVLEDGGDGSRALEEGKLDVDEVVNIQFTSGTTSMPKAACLTHRSILNNGRSIGDRMLLTPQDVVCCPPPLFHCFGCILGYMATATHGSAIVFPSESFNPLATLHAVRDYACTALYGVPTMFVAELELLSSFSSSNSHHYQQQQQIEKLTEKKENTSTSSFFPPDYDFHKHLRTGIAAGSSIPAELMRKLHRVLGLTDLTICYGMTETSPVSLMTTTTDPLHKRIETVGRLLPHVEAKIVDPTDRGRVCEVDERGELVVSGYLVMKGYWGDEARTSEVLIEDDEGKTWMCTGDEASMDEEGYVRITGRIKDIIIRGGENIHPLEIENCLFGHSQIAEASVVGLPDAKYGEVVAAFIVRHDDDDDDKSKDEGETLSDDRVREWVRERLSGHLVPKHIFYVSSYPKTASGKIQKFKLREMGVRLLAEENQGVGKQR